MDSVIDDNHDIAMERPSNQKSPPKVTFTKAPLIGILLGVVFGYVLNSQTPLSHFQFPNALLFGDPAQNKPVFEDLVGCESVKRQVQPYVQVLATAELPVRIQLPKFVFHGPEGTGKRTAAMALANEAGVEFLEIDMEDLIARKDDDAFLDALLAQSRKFRVLFISQADLHLPKLHRNRNYRMETRFMEASWAGGEEYIPLRESSQNRRILSKIVATDSHTTMMVLSTLQDLSWPELGSRKVVQLEFTNPDTKTRALLFDKKMPQLSDVAAEDRNSFLHRLAKDTHGFNGRDISAVCKRVLARAMLKNPGPNADAAESDVEEEIKEIKEHKPVLKEWEKQTVAYHEAGHAVVSWKLENADEMLAVSIVPDGGGALGYTRYSNKNTVLYTSEQVFAKICVLLAGKYSERYFMKRESTGARDDLSRVTGLAYYSVASYGFEGHFTSYDDKRASKRIYGEEVSRQIDADVKALISRANDIAQSLVNTHYESVRKVATALLEKDTLTYLDMQDILGPSTYVSKEHIDIGQTMIKTPVAVA